MKKLVGVAILAGFIATGTPARAQECAGDCDGSRIVVINELITCVTIALGSRGVEACGPCDVNKDGMVLVNELIAAVSKALGGCDTGAPFCGDNMVNVVDGVTPIPDGFAAGEECDDGNNVGGDGCAANCTNEVVRRTTLDTTASVANVQFSNGFNLPLALSGTQALTGGRPRGAPVIGPNGVQLFAVGEFPVITKVADIKFNPIELTNLGCACVRGFEVPEFGPGIAGMGVVGCGEQGLTDIDFLVEQDHNTTPGDAGNSGSANGFPDDPECDDVFELGGGIMFTACKEGVGDACNMDFNMHLTACQSPRHITFSGGQAPKGSTLIRNQTAIGVLQNNVLHPCADSNAPDFGPDHKACTDDDLEKGVPAISPTTSGTASVRIFDADDTAGATFGVGGNVDCQGCIFTATGQPTDCSKLNDETAGLTGALVTAFPGLDQQLGDAIITTTLRAVQ